MASISTSTLISQKRVNFLSNYLPRQNWSLPDSIIYYITKNPSSSKCYQKMIQSCKYFFIKNPIIMVSELFCDSNKKWYIGLQRYRQSYDFTNISSKFWIANEFEISSSSNSKLLSSLIPKIYQFDATKLQIFYQSITMNEFLFLSSNIQNIHFSKTTVIAENGSIVPLENIIAALPKLKYIQFFDIPDDSSITKNTVKQLLKIPHFAKLKFFCIIKIPQIFDIETFFNYIKKNQITRIYLSFVDSISNEYKNRLEEIIDENIAAENREYKLPFIRFHGLNGGKFYQMDRLFYNRNL